MVAQSRRIFVGNLPHEVTRDEIVNKFKNYGKVESVEIKTKKDPSSEEIVATFSYVNLNTDDVTLGTCIQFLNGIKWDGRHIKVEVAKESFLQRLQRERQASIKSASSQQPAALSQPQKSLDTSAKSTPSFKSNVPAKSFGKEIKAPNKKQESRYQSSSSESSESEDEKDIHHPTSKLLMFKGIVSLALNASSANVEPKLKHDDSFSVSSKEITLNKGSRATKPYHQKAASYNDSSSDVLRKFESFSDVWKDSDEPSHQSESKDRRFALQSGRKNNSQVSPDKYNIDRRDREAQKHSFQNGNQNITQQSSLSFKSSSNAAEEKRLKSLEAKREAFEQQKNAVKLALSDKTAPRVNKKIVFGDDNAIVNKPEIFETIEKRHNLRDKKLNHSKEKEKDNNTLKLFGDSDDESVSGEMDTEFQVKKQFEGEKGKKLLELQTRYNNDQRFKLDERFYDSDDEDEKRKKSTIRDQQGEGIEGLAEEREQQLQILSSVLGQPISTSHPLSHTENKSKGMLRFDPLKPNHSRYELVKQPTESRKKKRGKSTGNEEMEDEEENEETIKPKFRREEKDPEPVSQNKFYSVSDTLAESLKQAKEGEASGFSLLAMFGSPSVSKESKIQDEYKEVSYKTKGLKTRPARDESSSEDEECHDEGPTAFVKNNPKQSASKSQTSTNKSAAAVWQESFFFQPNDSRLKEGAEFFSCADTSEDSAMFAKKREALRHIVKLKVRQNTRKANSFNKKVSSMRRKASLWPSSHSNRVQKHRRQQRN